MTSSLSSRRITTSTNYIGDREDEKHLEKKSTTVVAANRELREPPYGRRKSWVPCGSEDFGDGDAFPEIPMAQFPLGMGNSTADENKLTADGKIKHDVFEREGHSRDKIVYSKYTDLLPKEMRDSYHDVQDPAGNEMEVGTVPKSPVKFYDDLESDRARSGHSSRRHERKKHHSKSKKRKKHRRRSRSASSSSSSRSGGSRNRFHRRHSRRRDSRSRSWSSDSRDAYSDYDRHRSRNRDVSGPNQNPTNTIMIRGLPLTLTEKEITADLQQCHILVKEIRLIRHRDTGLSRGFCFLEFHDVAEATRYMELKKGIVVYQEQYEASMIYSVGRATHLEDREFRHSSPTADWYCTKCSSQNFKRRDYCYKCRTLKPEDAEEFNEELSRCATTTLMLQNLDMLTTEDNVQQAIDLRFDLRSIPTKSIKISREAATSLSRGICFLETKSVSDAVRLYDALMQNPLQVDERTLRVAYCKPPAQAVSLNSAAAAALAAAQWSTSTASSSNISSSDDVGIQQLAEYSASLYAKTPEEKASYLTYYLGYYKEQQLKGEKLIGSGNIGGTTHRSFESIPTMTTSIEGTPQQVDVMSCPPDLSRLQYDSSSGYHYDPLTRLYYDSNNSHFYDSVRKEFLTWNSSIGSYVSVPPESNPSQEIPAANAEKEKKTKTPTIKVSKSVLQDTLKQAVKFNEKKYGNKVKVETAKESSPKTADFEPRHQSRLTQSIHAGLPHEVTTVEIDPADDSEGEEEKNSLRNNVSVPASDRFMDLEKLACTLCKRQFASFEILSKHTQLSELHKTNLANCTYDAEPKIPSVLTPSGYRDRAKERRKFFGPEDTEPKNTLKQKYMDAMSAISKQGFSEEPSRIEEDSVGSRLLQKMGWKAGKGLGKHETGRTDIIRTEMRAMNAGLGLPSSTLPPGGSDKDRYSRARHLTLERYRQIDKI